VKAPRNNKMSKKEELITEIKDHGIACVTRYEDSITLDNFVVEEGNYDLFLDYIEQTEGQIVREAK
jgi:hypothetical protein